LEIACQVNAKAINIPLSYNSYKPKPYAYFDFSSFENLEAAKELTVAFKGKGLTWHSPNEARELCHVCGRHGCSPSKCSPRPAKKTNDRLNKLYTRFNASPKRGRSDSQQNRSSSRSRSRSRSNSRSRGRGPSNHSNNISQSGPSFSGQYIRPQNKDKAKDINRQGSNDNSSFTSSSVSQNRTSIPPDVIKELKDQILEISRHLRSLDERVEALEYSITDHTYCIGELEAMMNYDDPSPHHDESSYQPEPYTHQDCGWDNEPYHDKNDNSFLSIQQGLVHSLIDDSPDVSFSSLDPRTILSRRHVKLPDRLNYAIPPKDTQIRNEILSVSTTHKEITN
jgi:hypothetical protein